MSEKNLYIWNQFSKTEPRYTKSFNKGGFQGSDVNPTYRLQCLTEMFGPHGVGWGWTIHSRWRESWPSRHKVDGKWTPHEADCAFVELSLWYVDDTGKRFETSPQIGGTEVDLAPDECWKMSITDAVGKCCAALGIAADIYLGQFDSKYQRDTDGPKPKPKVSAYCAENELLVQARQKLWDCGNLLDLNATMERINNSKHLKDGDKRILTGEFKRVADKIDQETATFK